MWLREHASVTLSVVYVAVLGALVIVASRCLVPADSLVHARIANTGAVCAVGALAWPFLWATVAHPERTMPWTVYVGLVWPPLLLLADVAFAQHGVGEDGARKASTLQYDASTLTGLAVTLGALMVKSVSDGYATAAAPMISATMLLALLFVMPAWPVHADSIHASTLRSLQKVVVQYCLGFALTAVGVCFSVSMLKASSQGTELRRAMVDAERGT